MRLDDDIERKLKKIMHGDEKWTWFCVCFSNNYSDSNFIYFKVNINADIIHDNFDQMKLSFLILASVLFLLLLGVEARRGRGMNKDSGKFIGNSIVSIL